jgi:hypothetical protein
MPKGLIGPLSNVFNYVTLDQLRDEGFAPTFVTDAKARSLITMASNTINWLTKQWFVPIRSVAKVDGRGASVFHLPNMIPILDLFQLQVGRSDLSITSLPSISYAVKERYVQMLSHKASLTAVPRFVIMDGVYGWLENDYAPVYTTLTSAVNSGDTSINVASVAGLYAGSVMLLGTNEAPLSGAVLVKAINGLVLTVDPVFFSCPVGDPAVQYGNVPSLIQRAVMLLVRDKITPVGLIGTSQDKDNPPYFSNRLNSESTEGYSYSLAQLPVAYGPGGGAFTTGNPEADDCCAAFCMPTMYVGAV